MKTKIIVILFFLGFSLKLQAKQNKVDYSAQIEAFKQNFKDIFLKTQQVHFVPEGAGRHGSKTLWNGFVDAAEYGTAVKGFLQEIK